MRANGAKVFIGIAGVVILSFLFAFQQKLINLPCWLRGESISSMGERQFSLGLEQPLMGGKVILDKIWLTQNNPEFLRVSGRFVGFEPKDHLLISSRIREEPNGFENGTMSWLVTLGNRNPQKETPFLFEYKAPPIAAKKLYLRIYVEEKYSDKWPDCKLLEVGDFELSNPFRQKPQQRQAEPLPARRSAEPLEVELTKLETSLFSPVPKKSGFRESCSRVCLRVQEAGKPTTRWRPMQYRLTGGDGPTIDNTISAGRNQVYGNDETTLAGTLWKCEGPWKVQVALMRTNDFRPDEMIQISDLPIPADGEVIQQDQRWKVGDNEVQFLGIAGGNVPGWHSNKEWLSLRFKMSGPRSSCLKLVSVSDGLGKVIRTSDEEYRGGGSPDDPFFFTLLRRDMRGGKINIKFGVVWERRDVEFVAEPTFSGQSYHPVPE